MTKHRSGQPACPQCDRDIPLEDFSVANDIALCRHCAKSWSYADVLERKDTVAFLERSPPSGAWHTPGVHGFEVGASTRSPLAFFLVPFMCVWSGFSLSGIYGSQITTGNFDLFRTLFGIPFLLGTIVFGSVALMSMGGKVVVSVRGDDARKFVGLGPFGMTRRFKWSQVTAVVDRQDYARTGVGNYHIVIEADKVVHLWHVNEDRRRFMLAVLKHYQPV